MNEQRFAYLVRQALEESSEQLPYRVTQRLERARLGALAHAPQTQSVASGLKAVGLLGTGVLSSSGTTGKGERPSVWVRLLATALPLLVVAAGLYGISVWTDIDDAADTAEIDAELVLGEDDVPVSALADKGFGVFLRNTRQ